MNANKIVEKIKSDFSLTPDLVIKTIKVNHLKEIYVIYLESLSSSDKVNNYVLKGINNLLKVKSFKNIDDIILSPNNVLVEGYPKLEYYLTSGFTVIIANFDKKIYAVETKAEIDRGISKSDFEQTLIGPKDAFTENYQKNLGLIKRRLKTSHLKLENYEMGALSKTSVGLLYLDNVVKDSLVNNVKEQLNKINIDAILDSANLRTILSSKHSKNRFPNIRLTEKPDYVCHELTNGKIAIICDNSPNVLVIPSFFIDYINPIDDNYDKPINIFIIKMLRILCLILTIIMPALYIAVTSYNQETIPISMLISFMSQRDGVPFPAFIEAFMMLIICEILRETDIRFPSSYGSSISILGSLVIGDAAVSAGIVSPIMIIVVAITLVTCLIFTDPEFKNALRFWSYIMLFLACTLGLYGICLGTILLLLKLSSMESFGIPYLFPFTPFDKSYFENNVIEITGEEKRSKILSENIVRRDDK